MKRIDVIKKIMRQRCPKGQLVWEWGGHILPVVKYSKILAKKLKADIEVVEIAAWLHDITKWKKIEDHHITGAKEAEQILKKLDYSKEKIERIKYCILAHRGSQKIKRNKEAKCVATADAMAHFKAIPSLYFIAFSVNNKSFLEGEKWVKDKLKRSWKKLIPEAKHIIKKKFEASQEIL